MRRIVIAGLIAAGSLPTAAAAQATLERRVDRLEQEMGAVQREVFPKGAGRTLRPDIADPDASISVPGSPASSVVTDLDARVAAMEQQQRALTGQVEQNQNRIRQLEDAFAAYKRSTDARLKALEETAATPTPDDAAPALASPRPAVVRPPVARPGAPVATTLPARTATTPARAAQLAAIERPKTADPAEDAYIYGYRLYDGGFQGEAQAVLRNVVDKYPRHRRASWAQNLLGLSYLKEKRPSLASIAFYDSFKKFPEGERAPQSLFFLAQALIDLKKPADACKVYDELEGTYPTRISADMRRDIVQRRAAAKCP